MRYVDDRICPYCREQMDVNFSGGYGLPLEVYLYCSKCRSQSPKTPLKASMISPHDVIRAINDEWEEVKDEEMYAKVSEMLRNHRRIGVD